MIENINTNNIDTDNINGTLNCKKNKKNEKNQNKKIKRYKLINKNFFRNISKYILNVLKRKGIKNVLIGCYYGYLHFLIFILVGFNLLFNMNVYHLVVLLVIVSFDAISIVILHNCPLTTLEEKYLGINSCEERTYQLKQLGVFYKCKHEYEKQLELLTNVWALIAVKCLAIMFLKMFNYKLNNWSNLYEKLNLI